MACYAGRELLGKTAAAAVIACGIVAVHAAASVALEPARGRFLVAERDLRDPNFRETVVLLTDYGKGGAMGVIVNWPSAAPVAELVPQIEGIAERVDTIFVGGPVSRQVMLMLVRAKDELPLAERIFADVHLSSSRELLEQLVAGQIGLRRSAALQRPCRLGAGPARGRAGGRRLAGGAGRRRAGVRGRPGARLAGADAARRRAVDATRPTRLRQGLFEPAAGARPAGRYSPPDRRSQSP